MALKAKILGREALTRRLNQLAPNVEKAVEPVKLAIAEEAAKRIASAAPRNTGDYASKISSGLLRDNPDKKQVGIQATKDPTAAGIYAPWFWNFLEFGTASHAIGSGTHPGTTAQPHVFTTWRAYRKSAMRKMRTAINKAVREARK